MSDYRAPLRDIRFNLEALAELPEIRKLPRFQEATPDVVDAVLEEAGKLAAEVLAPLNPVGDRTGNRVVDRAVLPPEGFKSAYRAFVDGGWPALPFAPERGGQGLPETVSTAVNEIWQSANMAFALCPMLTEGTVVALEQHASDAIKDRFLEKLISGEWTGTMNLTEPQAGSDLAAVKTRAEPRADHYLLFGQKIFITWGDHNFTDNIIHMVLARLPDAPPGVKGISLFVVPKFLLNPDGTRGKHNDVYPVSVEHKLGIHGSPTCVMSYGDRGGAVGYLIGQPHNGLALMFTMMNHARLAVGIQGLSISERAYQKARAYARERVQGQIAGRDGRVTIIHHADVRRMLMLMKSGIEAMRALCYVASAAADFAQHGPDQATRARHQERFALLTPVVKGWCTELAQELTYLGVQIHGGMGFIEETGAAQHCRDARILTIYEGTTGIQANDLIGRKLLRDNGRAMAELIREMREVAAAAGMSADADIKVISSQLGTGIAALEQAVAWLLDHADRNAAVPGSVAVNMVMLVGTVCGGWLLARAALIARSRLDSADAEFLSAKITTARFYAEHFLSRASSLSRTICAGADSMMALTEAQF
ncbi:MAG: acyl-CoA dehydrogenase [Gammaproteobacteria bacterium]|nr:acyl-CoA dehydrogenase [Gammaproteobacteria bacterium]